MVKKKLVDLFFNREFLYFLIIGIINTFNGVLFSVIFSYKFNGKFAFVLGYVFSLTISYFLNSKISFKKNLSFGRFIKFCISYVPNFSIQFFLVWMLLDLFGWPKVIVYIISAVIGVPITFILIKFYALKNKKA